MRRERSSLTYFSAWAELNGVHFHGVAVSPIPNGKGTGLIATAELSEPEEILITVPHNLILSSHRVWINAKADRHLREILEAVGEFSRVACSSASSGVAGSPMRG